MQWIPELLMHSNKMFRIVSFENAHNWTIHNKRRLKSSYSWNTKYPDSIWKNLIKAWEPDGILALLSIPTENKSTQFIIA